MPQPNEHVVNAIIESYLGTRKLQWSLENQDGKVILPSDDTETARKIDVCVKILQKTTNDRPKTDDWIEIIKLLNELEQKETTELTKVGWVRKLFGSTLLLETVQAIRSYILETIQDGYLYKDRISSIVEARNSTETIHTNYTAHPDKHRPEQIAKAKIAMDAAEAAYKPYDLEFLMLNKRDHHTYFTKNLAKDPKSIALKEKTFEDFENNVIDHLHKPDLCTRLLAQTHAAKVEVKADTVTNKPIVQETPKAPPAPQPAIAAVPVQPVTAVVPDSMFTAPKPVAAADDAPSAQPKEPHRYNTRNKHNNSKETKSSLQSNSTFKQPAKPSTSSSTSQRSNKSKDPDWDDDFEIKNKKSAKSSYSYY